MKYFEVGLVDYANAVPGVQHRSRNKGTVSVGGVLSLFCFACQSQWLSSGHFFIRFFHSQTQKRLRTHYVLDGCTSWHTLPTGPARHRHEGTFAQTTKNNPAKSPGAQRYDISVSFNRLSLATESNKNSIYKDKRWVYH